MKSNLIKNIKYFIAICNILIFKLLSTGQPIQHLECEYDKLHLIKDKTLYKKLVTGNFKNKKISLSDTSVLIKFLNLKDLEIRDGKIEIKSSFKDKLPYLKSLSISGDFIGGIPNDFINNGLEEILIRGSKPINFIPTCIFKTKTLRKISLSNFKNDTLNIFLSNDTYDYVEFFNFEGKIIILDNNTKAIKIKKIILTDCNFDSLSQFKNFILEELVLDEYSFDSFTFIKKENLKIDKLNLCEVEFNDYRKLEKNKLPSINKLILSKKLRINEQFFLDFAKKNNIKIEWR